MANLQSCFDDSSPSVPIIFILSPAARHHEHEHEPSLYSCILIYLARVVEHPSQFPSRSSVRRLVQSGQRRSPPFFSLCSRGQADPTQFLLSFAKDNHFERKLEIVSLGRGKGPQAERVMETAMAGGLWVCLQNCHRAIRSDQIRRR